MMSLPFIIGVVIGFILFYIITHPSHPKSFRHKLPAFRLIWFELNPRTTGALIKLKMWRYQIHLHHWLNLAVIYLALSVYPSNVLDPHLTLQGIIFGGLVQGLTYPDRFLIIKKL